MTVRAPADITSVFNLDSSERRLTLFIALIVAAVLSPNIAMPAGLPAVRLEQFILAVFLPSLVLFHLRHREYRRLTFLDFVFVLLGLAVTLSIILAPTIVDAVDWSLRDPFEVARVVEYWLMYRLGMTLVPSEKTSRTIILTLLCASTIAALFALLQYLDGDGWFNENITDLWAVEHNLNGVRREGRVIGPIGNANYYSAFSALPIIAGLAYVLLKKPLQPGYVKAIVLTGTVASVFAAVLTQSRTGAASILFGTFVGLVLVFAWRRPAAPVRAIGLFLGGIVLAVTFIQVQPPLVDSFNSRFNPASVDDDASFIIRIQRFRTFFTGFFAEKPAFCEGDTYDKRVVAPSHAPRPGAVASTAAPDVQARDATRKADVVDVSNAVLAYFCDEDAWPVGEDLSEQLVPDHLAAMPVDPSTGEPYLADVESGGFWIGAQLEDQSDPEGPIYTLGTNPNVVRNPSFEGTSYGSVWGAREGAEITAVAGEGLFGADAALLTIPPGGDVRQFIVFDFPLGTEHVASAWIRSTTGQDERLNLYLIATAAAGSDFDGFAKQVFTAPASGEWVPISLPFETDPKTRFTTLQFMLRGEDLESGVTVMIDGATVTQAEFAPSFPSVSDVDPATLRPVDLPQFSDSPLVGVGPRNDAQSGAFDNEYILMLDAYGLFGAGPYLAMYFGAIAVAIRAWRARMALMDVMGLTGFAFTMTLLLFNVGAGSFYHFALMAIYWLFIGYLASWRPRQAGSPVAVERTDSQAAMTNGADDTSGVQNVR